MSYIKFSYETDDGTKVVHEISSHADLSEVLEQFKFFIKGMGYHPPEGDLEFVDYDDTTIDDLYAEGYKDGMDVAKREMENGTFNTNNFVGTGSGLDIDDCNMLDGIKARAYRCEQERSELRTVPGNDSDGEDCCEAPQTEHAADFDTTTVRSAQKCINCGTLSITSNE